MNYYNCIYMYVNKINGKRYIGQTKDFNKRHKQHIKLHKMIIDRAFDKYGEDNFEIIILAHDVPTQEQLDSYERFFIKRYKTFTSQHGYNVAEGGSNGNPRKDFTEEQLEGWKQKLREANLGKEMSQETKDKISNSLQGREITEETREKMGAWQRGLKRPSPSDETRQKMSEAHSGEKNGFYGKKHSQESLKKMSEWQLGDKSSRATKVICLNTKQVFNTVKEAGEWCGLKSCSSISACCNNKRKVAGRHPETGEKLKWMYLKDYEKLNE